MCIAIKARDVLAECQLVECQVLGQAELICSIDAHSIVDHIGWGIALCWREDMHAKPIFDMHDGAGMCLDSLHPAFVPGRKYILALCHRERLLNLANRVCLANI